jgi:hypothetical protein
MALAAEDFVTAFHCCRAHCGLCRPPPHQRHKATLVVDGQPLGWRPQFESYEGAIHPRHGKIFLLGNPVQRLWLLVA